MTLRIRLQSRIDTPLTPSLDLCSSYMRSKGPSLCAKPDAEREKLIYGSSFGRFLDILWEVLGIDLAFENT